MGTPNTRMGKGTINAIRKVWVDAMWTNFAMVMPEDGCSRLAVRIGPNLTPGGQDHFFVGDKVKYTLILDSSGEFPRALDLVKSGTRSA
ncbi:hypothetical protein DKY63_05280 [Pseudomonas putida]|uniref:Uncharacterized protein n=1 Tax=Pseudomonas putida TaxID=303 RepID=A0A2Z4RG82_PSEPU|nr:hypothetical protein [Pseudomonas putida]AWY39348.1 hypothetical protein DKY63_05280 [Pseudomonas putida]